ncbi:MAG TPA: hypothetical protein VLV88_02305 [Terriglobales bacterium]|nr:hypothetical protein [Terriglobales bacterium]
MDDYGKNLADETNEMAAEAVINPSAELRKRRSTRIVQAVPLVVTGVDALGRPFVERTSSLIINCHGCRYQSKHYVLKNMWVTLEIPHPEAGEPPRTVRGRVAWIQRPRTVRQLFQVALELEAAGNVWGIAFPPEDWFAQSAAPEIKSVPATGTELPPAALPQPGTEAGSGPGETETPASAGSNDNLRMFPAPTSTTDASLQLARQVARLIADAKQQVYAAAKDAASQAVSAERRVAFDQWEQKFAAAREEVSHEANRAIDRIHQDADEHTRSAYAAAAEALRNELPKWLAPQLEELTYELTRRLAKTGADQREEHEHRIAEISEKVQRLCEHAQEVGARVGAEAAQAEALIQERMDAAARAMEETAKQHEQAAAARQEAFGAAAEQMQRQLGAAMAEAEASLQARITGELDAAQGRLQGAAESAAAAAREQTSAGVDEQVQTARARLQEQIQNETERHAARLRDAAAAIHEEAERRLGAFRHSIQNESGRLDASLATAQGSIQQLEQFSSRLSEIQQQSLSGFQSQLDDVLSLHRLELHRRSEALFQELNGRIRGTFDEVIEESLGKFDEQIRSLVDPHVTRTDEAVQRLAGGRSLLDAAMTMQQERIRGVADEAFAESLGRFRENLGGVEQLLQESAQGVLSRNLADLENKAGDVRHQAVEEIYKSAEWYEKKVQTQLNSLTDKVVEQAGNQLREKAGEVSAVFASEVDHASRSFVQHTQTQMAEVVHDAFDRARALFAEAADTTSAAFTDEIQRHARLELEGFETAVTRSSEESRANLETKHAEMTQRLTAEQEQFLRKFQQSMHSALDSGVADVQQKVQAGLSPLLESWKSLTDAYQSEMRSAYERLGNQAAEHFRGRLENASNSWLVATVSMLDHQSHDVVAGIAKSAEEKLRATCAQVFSGIGDTLRDRLQKITQEIGKPPMEESQPK